jgi:hypothetical protein
MYILAHVVALIAGTALSRAWPAALRVGGVGPDLVLVLVTCVGITRGRLAGYAAGVAGGFLMGAAGHGEFLPVMVSLMVIGLLSGLARGRIFSDHILVAPLVAVLGTLLAALVHFVVSPPSGFVPWIAELARLAVYNAVLSPIAYVYCTAVGRRWPQRSEA